MICFSTAEARLPAADAGCQGQQQVFVFGALWCGQWRWWTGLHRTGDGQRTGKRTWKWVHQARPAEENDDGGWDCRSVLHLPVGRLRDEQQHASLLMLPVSAPSRVPEKTPRGSGWILQQTRESGFKYLENNIYFILILRMLLYFMLCTNNLWNNWHSLQFFSQKSFVMSFAVGAHKCCYDSENAFLKYFVFVPSL